MKKRIYLTIIGIGALWAIIGFASPGVRAIWGILIAGVTGLLYYFNSKNERRVQERLEEVEDTKAGKPDDSADSTEASPDDDSRE